MWYPEEGRRRRGEQGKGGVGVERRVAEGKRGEKGRKGARGSERRRSKVKKEGTNERTVRSEQWLAHARISSNALARNAIGEPV